MFIPTIHSIYTSNEDPDSVSHFSRGFSYVVGPQAKTAFKWLEKHEENDGNQMERGTQFSGNPNYDYGG